MHMGSQSIILPITPLELVLVDHLRGPLPPQYSKCLQISVLASKRTCEIKCRVRNEHVWWGSVVRQKA